MIPCFLIIAHNTGGVVTLDPCDHLCSLDGVQVTVPTPLTQGKIDHAHTKEKCRLSKWSWPRGAGILPPTDQ